MVEVKVAIAPTLDVEGTTLRVLAYELHDELSRPGMLRCEAMEDDQKPRNPADLIGKQAVFDLLRTDGAEGRSFVGRVVVAERRPDADDVRTLHLRIASAPWALTKRADCRVYQDKSVVDIVTEVLEGAGVGSDRQDWQVVASYAPRPYVVQYRESDYDFVTRLLAEEGIYYAVVVRDGQDVMVFGDAPNGLAEMSPATLPFHHGAGFEEALDVVMRVTQRHAVRSDKVTVRDYNFEQPKLEVESSVESPDDGEHVLEVYDYPGRCADSSEAERLAQVRLEELQRDRRMVEGETGTLTMSPGLRFTIEQHPYAPLNQELILQRLQIVGTTPRLGAATEGGAACRVRFAATPSTTPCRPPYVEPATQIAGLQTSVTTGPGGEEIHVSGSGQVRIHYHWDRLGALDDTSSPFVRTSQLPTGGSMLLPRMGWEVTTTHLEGDPTRPLVMGRVYNGTSPPPYGLPDGAARGALQTNTTPGGGSVNELRTDDTSGSEEMFFNASKDMSVDVKNNTTEAVGNNVTHDIGSNHTKNVTNSQTRTIGASQSITIGGDQTLTIQTQLQDQIGGDHSLTIGGNRDLKVGGDHKREVGADSSLDIGGMQIDLVVGSTTDDTLANFVHEVGAALLDITPADRSLTVGGSITERAGAAKIIGTLGGRGVEVGGNLMQMVAGAVVHIASGDRKESAGGMFTEIAAGAHVVKAENITIEAETLLSVVMGPATITLVPAAVAVAATKVKLDGDVADTGALVVDN